MRWNSGTHALHLRAAPVWLLACRPPDSNLHPAATLSPLSCQADGTGAKLDAPTAPAGTDLAAQFSITWEDVPPSKIGELQAATFKAAILKQLPAGGVRRCWWGAVVTIAWLRLNVGHGWWAAAVHSRAAAPMQHCRSPPALLFCRCWRLLHHNDH